MDIKRGIKSKDKWKMKTIKENRKEIAKIITTNLDLMVEKKTKKGIIINSFIVENVADCILLSINNAFELK